LCVGAAVESVRGGVHVIEWSSNAAGVGAAKHGATDCPGPARPVGGGGGGTFAGFGIGGHGLIVSRLGRGCVRSVILKLMAISQSMHT
jgi:hypothetical protein